MLNLNMIEGYANTLPCSEVSDDSNHIHTKVYPNTFKYWIPKHGVEDKVVQLYDN